MRKVTEVLRLKHEAKLSHENIACAVGLSKGAVGKYVNLAKAQGITWPLPPGMDEAELEAKLLQGQTIESFWPIGWQRPAGCLVDFANRSHTINLVAAVSTGNDFLYLIGRIGSEIAYDFFQNIFQGHQSLHLTVLIDHYRKAIAILFKVKQLLG